MGFDKSEGNSEGQQRVDSADSAKPTLFKLIRKLARLPVMNKRDLVVAMTIAVALATVYVLYLLEFTLPPTG